jgi:hypothetical protein
MPSSTVAVREEPKPATIIERIGDIDNAVNHLIAVLDELEKHLASVLRDPMPSEATIGGPAPREAASPLALKLGEIASVIHERRRVVESLLNRLEL